MTFSRAERPVRRLRVPALAALAAVCGLTFLSSGGLGQAPRACLPSFEAAPFNRGLPHAFADQGLQSIPLLFPRHQLLVERRIARAGSADYSLLVYQKDAAVDEVTIEGVAVHEQRAWRFAAACEARQAWDGLVTLLERIAALPRDPATR
jgi:hypothetical protein